MFSGLAQPYGIFGFHWSFSLEKIIKNTVFIYIYFEKNK